MLRETPENGGRISRSAEAVTQKREALLDYVDGHAPADELMREIDYEVIIVKYREEWR